MSLGKRSSAAPSSGRLPGCTSIYLYEHITCTRDQDHTETGRSQLAVITGEQEREFRMRCLKIERRALGGSTGYRQLRPDYYYF